MAYSDNYNSDQAFNLERKYASRPSRTLRISLRTNREQCAIIKSIQFKWIKLFDIHHEFVLVFNKEIYTLASVKHWIHELRTKRKIMTDETWPGKPSINHIDVLILKRLDNIHFVSVRSLSDDLRIPKTTISRRLTNSFQFKCCHFK
jgi:hypothetical protein